MEGFNMEFETESYLDKQYLKGRGERIKMSNLETVIKMLENDVSAKTIAKIYGFSKEIVLAIDKARKKAQMNS
jgi:hypothetical protein